MNHSHDMNIIELQDITAEEKKRREKRRSAKKDKRDKRDNDFDNYEAFLKGWK